METKLTLPCVECYLCSTRDVDLSAAVTRSTVWRKYDNHGDLEFFLESIFCELQIFSKTRTVRMTLHCPRFITAITTPTFNYLHESPNPGSSNDPLWTSTWCLTQFRKTTKVAMFAKKWFSFVRSPHRCTVRHCINFD